MEYEELTGKKKWLVIHDSELYDINPNLIGFRDPSAWRRIKENDIIFYYRTSPYMQIMGIYKVIRSEEGIDKNFRIVKDGKSEYLKHQHQLELVNPFQRHFGTSEHKRLSFYHTLKIPNRWDGYYVYSMTFGDLALIMR
jgi:hypothetical protein